MGLLRPPAIWGTPDADVGGLALTWDQFDSVRSTSYAMIPGVVVAGAVGR